MKAINSGDRYDIYSDAVKTYDQLPANTYSVRFNDREGFFLIKRKNLEINEKVYGIHEAKVDKVLNSFSLFTRNLGVILSGNKGIGKSLFAKMLCAKAISKGYPVIIIDKFYPGIASYLEIIDQEVVVLFDEFDKTFGSINVDKNEADAQAGMLSLFDGTSVGKKLFVITCNSLWRLSDYLVNRPGRFHYHFRFDYPTATEIRGYLSDKLDEKYHEEIGKVIAFSTKVTLNYDCLRSIAFELNMGIPFDESIQDLNIVNTEREAYRITLYFQDGTTLINRRYSMDMFDNTQDVVVEMDDIKGEYICDIKFNTGTATYDGMSGRMIIPEKAFKITYWDDDAPEDMKSKVPSHVVLSRVEERKIHYLNAI